MSIRSIPRKLAIIAMLALVATLSVPPTEARGQSPNLVERLEQMRSFNILLAALDAADLTETVASAEALTIFAPTDRAFLELLGRLGVSADALLAREDLTNILLYHVIPGKIRAGELLEESTQATLNGGRPLLVLLEDRRFQVNGNTVVRANVGARNGVIHAIDGVLLPPAEPESIGSILDVLRLDGRFSILLAALDEAGLDSAVAGPGLLTLFAPTDEAFGALLADLGATPEQLLAREDLGDILLYHVAGGERRAFELLRSRSVETLQGDDVHVRIRRGGVFVNRSLVVSPNVEAPNGIIHFIDKVLLP